jgi:hypothetical protein
MTKEWHTLAIQHSGCVHRGHALTEGWSREKGLRPGLRLAYSQSQTVTRQGACVGECQLTHCLLGGSLTEQSVA